MGIAGAHHRGNGGGNFRLDEKIPSNSTAGRRVQEQIMNEVIRRGYNHQSTFAIKLALEEAVNNAIKHGNRLNSRKHVHIQAFVAAGKAEFIIEDEGPGFDRSGVPDPTLEENLEKCSGRGILLIEAYMDKVEWSLGGRRLRMLKKN
jgi:serine/threonine-protein kinase RsbW